MHVFFLFSYADLSDVAKSTGRVVAVLHRNSARQQESKQSTDTNPGSEYEFTDSDETL